MDTRIEPIELPLGAIEDDSVDLGMPEIQLQPASTSEHKPCPAVPPTRVTVRTDERATGGKLAAAFSSARQRPGPIDTSQLLAVAVEDIMASDNYASFMPLLFRVGPDRPFSLHEFLPFVPLYDRQVPRQILLKTGSQCGKTTNLTFRSLLLAATIPNFRVLFLTPLQTQCLRFSRNCVRQAINNSFPRGLIVDRRGTDNPMQRSLANGSALFFSHAFRECERAREIPCDYICFDGVENMSVDLLPIIAENLSASDFGVRVYAGTGRTLDDTMYSLWNESSQAEWIVRCRSCGKENLPLSTHDLFNMLGESGLVCAGCGYELDSMADGRYVHQFPDRVADFPGLHIGQPILPLYYRSPQRWKALLKKVKTLPKAKLCNLVFGEDCDVGVRVLPVESLKKASVLPFPNEFAQGRDHARDAKYVKKSLGIDWGGKTQTKDAMTAMAVVGLRSDGKTDILHAVKMDPSTSKEQEMAMARHLYQEFECTSLGHGLRGVGESRRMALEQLGLRQVMAWLPETTSAGFFAKEHRTAAGVDYTRLNRSAGIQLLAHEIASAQVFLPQWREDLSQNPFMDLSSWYENTIEHSNGRTTCQILRSARQPDNVGMAALYGTCTNWRVTNCWPSHMRELKPEGIVVATDEEMAAVAETAI